MPYITPDRRIAVDSGVPPQNPGELNYRLTRLALDFLAEHGTSYQTINDIVGALTCCKDEFQRRVVADYEIEKAATNGDVYMGSPRALGGAMTERCPAGTGELAGHGTSHPGEGLCARHVGPHASVEVKYQGEAVPEPGPLFIRCDARYRRGDLNLACEESAAVVHHWHCHKTEKFETWRDDSPGAWRRDEVRS
jgi:hypothetical protein